MNPREQLRRMGFPEDVIATATVNGKPLKDIVHQYVGKRPPLKHDLADAFCEMWKRLGPDRPPTREYRFHPTRKWRFDVAWPDVKVAVELEGGVWTLGRHTRGAGFRKDMKKYNAAALLGWRLLRFAANDLEFGPMDVIEQVVAALDGAQTELET